MGAIPEGPVPFPHNMMDQLQKLGLRLKLEKGVLMNTTAFPVCSIGDTLSPEACQLLKLWDVRTVQFHLQLTGHWTGGVCRRIKPLREDDMAEDEGPAAEDDD
eukprot:NODE_3995_length_366_cov_351.744479_g3415_i0.p1 GENE.NODE_3995_length_366_cov_351.744479_g3415_i0~~NODE_3995_length_366_cov_351.744479_g3415_i0.p1  ORF type:complete len:103 (+),score=20.93 NODE_3995_length_366_cov_351.744479_g3415_i0:31-339(+)